MEFSRYSMSLLVIINFLLLYAHCKTGEVCTSQGGRFPRFSKEGKPPSEASKGPKAMNFCKVFRKRSCCDVTQTHPALLSTRRLASSGEASEDCLQLWELLECSICDPQVGVQHGLPRICASFCDKVYETCLTAYFSMDSRAQVLAPCGLGDLICGKASEWVSNGTELCRAIGFSVKSSDDPTEQLCYGEKEGLDYIVNSWKTSHSETLHEEQNSGVLQGLRQWMAYVELVSWAIGGMVLIAAILFVRMQ